MSDDNTFRSDLVDVLTKHNIGEISSTSPEIIATSIENHIQGFNLTTVQRDKANGNYIEVLESELERYKQIVENKLESEINGSLIK